VIKHCRRGSGSCHALYFRLHPDGWDRGHGCEGEKDEAPMLYIGERIGGSSELQVDIVVDPIDGTTSVARGLPGTIS
jgi:hypothetical protein